MATVTWFVCTFLNLKCARCRAVIGQGEVCRQMRAELTWCAECAREVLNEEPPRNVPPLTVADQAGYTALFDRLAREGAEGRAPAMPDTKQPTVYPRREPRDVRMLQTGERD